MDLVSDCSRCVGLCCVALPFGRSADFAFDKAGGEPCRHLGGAAGDARGVSAGDGQGAACTIHASLRSSGMRGCTVYECFGAGQHVVQITYGGRASAADPGVQAAFTVVRALHELLVLLAEAVVRTDAAADGGDLDGGLAGRARALRDQVLAVRDQPAAALAGADLDDLHRACGDLLREVSALVRRPPGAAPTGPGGARGDLLGRDLRRHDVRRADLRGALLVAADLRGADLTGTDLLGADLRDTDLTGADASGALFLTQPQVNAARGSAGTRLPPGLARPPHWNDDGRAGRDAG